MVLIRLGQYIMDVKQNTRREDGGWVDTKLKHNSLLPLILSFESETRDTALVVGISPIHRALGCHPGTPDIEEAKYKKFMRHTIFWDIFREAAAISYSEFRFVSFDHNAVEVSRKDLDVFIGSCDKYMTDLAKAHGFH